MRHSQQQCPLSSRLGSGHGLIVSTAALLFSVSKATGVEVEQQKLEWSKRALHRLPQREQGVLNFHHTDVCQWSDLREVRALFFDESIHSLHAAHTYPRFRLRLPVECSAAHWSGTSVFALLASVCQLL